MCPRTGATAAPRATIASASPIASATSRGSSAKMSSREECLHLFEGLVVADPAVAEAHRAPKSGRRRAADQDREPAVRVRPRRKAEAGEIVDLTVKFRLARVPARAERRQALVRDLRAP